MDEVYLRTFPGNDREALAMLYVQSQDLTDITPEELVRMYDYAYETISAIRYEQECKADGIEMV